MLGVVWFLIIIFNQAREIANFYLCPSLDSQATYIMQFSQIDDTDELGMNLPFATLRKSVQLFCEGKEY